MWEVSQTGDDSIFASDGLSDPIHHFLNPTPHFRDPVPHFRDLMHHFWDPIHTVIWVLTFLFLSKIVTGLSKI